MEMDSGHEPWGMRLYASVLFIQQVSFIIGCLLVMGEGGQVLPLSLENPTYKQVTSSLLPVGCVSR